MCKPLLGLRVGRFIHWKEFCISNTVYIIFGAHVHVELCEKKNIALKMFKVLRRGAFIGTVLDFDRFTFLSHL